MAESMETRMLKWMVRLLASTLVVLLGIGGAATGWAIQMERGVAKISATLEAQAVVLIRQDRMEERTDARLKKIEDDISWFRAFRAATKKKGE